MKEFKTLVFKDSAKGRTEMGKQLDKYGNLGWEVKNKETTQQGWHAGKTCCLGVVFLPLALLGKQPNVITVILERESTTVVDKPDEVI